MAARSLAEYRETIEEFEAMLRELGILVESGSALEKAFLASEFVDLREKGEVKLDQEEQVTELRRAIGVLALVEQALLLRGEPFVKAAASHLKLLAKYDVVAAQNVEHRITDQGTKKVFELLIGMMAYRLAGNVELEPPDGGRPSENPDVITVFDGVRWGIACKAISSRNPETWAQRIRDGVRQILRSGVDRGVVAVNLAAIFPYREFVPHETSAGESRGVFSNVRDVTACLHEWLEMRLAELRNVLPLWPVVEVVSGSNVRRIFDVPACWFYVAVPAVIRLDDGHSAWQLVVAFAPYSLSWGDLDEGVRKFLSGLAEHSGQEKLI